MKKQIQVPDFSLATSARARKRGASMVEYALLLVAVLLFAAAAYKNLGPLVGQAATSTAGQL
jgi:Flp pilus assembly pilin Flp